MELKKRIIAAKQKIFHKAYKALNDKQREAVFSTEGPLLVLAGAGSGKTTVLVSRLEFIVKYGNAFFREEIPAGTDALRFYVIEPCEFYISSITVQIR